MKAVELANKICEEFETCDVFEIAQKSRVKIVYQKWFPVTLGEFDWQTKTICVNENAEVKKEQIIAHELGHYFLREFDLKDIVDEENFCDEFAREFSINEEEFHAKAQRAQS